MRELQKFPLCLLLGFCSVNPALPQAFFQFSSNHFLSKHSQSLCLSLYLLLPSDKGNLSLNEFAIAFHQFQKIGDKEQFASCKISIGNAFCLLCDFVHVIALHHWYRAFHLICGVLSCSLMVEIPYGSLRKRE